MSDFDQSFTQPSAPATPTAVDTPAPAITGQTAPQGATIPATATGGQPGTSPATTGGAPGEGWVPSYRLREQREALERQVAERERNIQANYEARIREAEQKIRALAGFEPPANPEVETVKNQFAQLFPALAKLTDDKKVEALLQLVEQSQDYEQQTNHYWQSFAQQRVGQLYQLAEQDIGQQLSEAARGRLHASFRSYVESSPEAMQAYTSDPQFVSNFWKAWSSDFIEPVRRVSAASAQTRAGMPIPQDTPGVPRTSGPANPQGIDERLNAGWAQYINTRR